MEKSPNGGAIGERETQEDRRGAGVVQWFCFFFRIVVCVYEVFFLLLTVLFIILSMFLVTLLSFWLKQMEPSVWKAYPRGRRSTPALPRWPHTGFAVANSCALPGAGSDGHDGEGK